MRGVSGESSIRIPKGWEAAAFFGRLVTRGVMTFKQLQSPETTPKAVFFALRALDIETYCELKATEKARKANDC